MKRQVSFLVAALAIASLSLAAPASADPAAFDLAPLSEGPAASLRDMAPMDREFGHLHLTPFGVANTIAAAGSRFTDDSSRDELSGGSFAYAIDALRDWERSFPRDPLVARDLARIAHVYARLHSEAAHEFASRAVGWLERDYPDTGAARDARNELELARSDAAPPDVDASFADLDAPPQTVARPEPDEAWQRYDVARRGH